ncbi:hypothetical protein LBMAG03_11460 [Actinomycetes bacterium]|nr:hypothetical protein LBMAG03_11460 [Actinomycetes bacterium]
MPNPFPFPHPVNETSARIVAAGAVVMSATFAATGAAWILIPLTYGFVARVTTGPALSPLGLLATKVITPRLNVQHRFVAGPPKRFAQFVGVLFSATASVLWLLDLGTVARIVAAMLAGAAFLESAFAVCLGCIMFGWLIRWGVVPERICEQCNNLNLRTTPSA